MLKVYAQGLNGYEDHVAVVVFLMKTKRMKILCGPSGVRSRYRIAP